MTIVCAEFSAVEQTSPLRSVTIISDKFQMKVQAPRIQMLHSPLPPPPRGQDACTYIHMNVPLALIQDTELFMSDTNGCHRPRKRCRNAPIHPVALLAERRDLGATGSATSIEPAILRLYCAGVSPETPSFHMPLLAALVIMMSHNS